MRTGFLRLGWVISLILLVALIYVSLLPKGPQREPARRIPVLSARAATADLERQVGQERVARIDAESQAAAAQDALKTQRALLLNNQAALKRAMRSAARAQNDVAELRERFVTQAASVQPAPISPPPFLNVAPEPPSVSPALSGEEGPAANTITVEEQQCAKDSPCPIKVFFATDRKLVAPARVPPRFHNLKNYFGGDRELDPKVGLQLGECTVTIPHTHYQKFSGKLDYAGTYLPDTSIFVKDVNLASRTDEWIAELNKRVEADPKKEMFVFIHGYNVTFIEAARRTAQIYYDLGFQGAPVFYSWPSGGNLWNYWADEASVEWSENHLREFLDLLAKQSHATRIHLIAHSMGTRALTHALAEIGARSASDQPADCRISETKFQEVILAAPDLDTDLFLQLNSGIKSAASRVTLYASKRDRAVLASWLLHHFNRLGFPGKTAPPNIDAIDASAASSDFLGHSYYGESALWDMKLIFERPDMPIDKRCTVRRDNGAAFYTFLAQNAKPPGHLTRLAKFVFRKRDEPDIINTSCPINKVTVVASR